MRKSVFVPVCRLAPSLPSDTTGERAVKLMPCSGCRNVGTAPSLEGATLYCALNQRSRLGVRRPDMSVLLKTSCAICAFRDGACRIEPVRGPDAH